MTTTTISSGKSHSTMADINNTSCRPLQPGICLSTAHQTSNIKFFLLTFLFLVSRTSLLTHPQTFDFFIPRPGIPSTMVHDACYFHCGNTTASARSMGCQYDILDNHWVPVNATTKGPSSSINPVEHGMAMDTRTQRRVCLSRRWGIGNFHYTNLRDHVVHCAML